VSYPVQFEADYAEQRSRLSVFFRLFLLIPLAIMLMLYGLVAEIAIVIAWFAIVITARYPAALYGFVSGFTRFYTRFIAYAAVLCDPYPPLGGGPDSGYPVRMEFAGPLERYSRAKTFFRLILAIPILIARYVLGVLLEVGAIAAWVVIVITGKMPRGLFDLMVLANSYIARSDAYIFLLTETYPPFQDEQTRAAGVAQGATAGALTPPPQGLPAERPHEPAPAEPVHEDQPRPGD